jgi:hypothetical protein
MNKKVILSILMRYNINKRGLFGGFNFRAILIYVLSLFVIMCFFGCEEGTHRTLRGRTTPKKGQISKEELRASLEAFAEYFRASVKETTDKINESDITTRMRKTNLILRARTLQTINTMLEQEDPMVAFIETWVFVVRLCQYFEEGEGRSLYGDNQHILIEAVAQLQTKTEIIGRTFMKEEVFEETRKNVISFAHSNPLKTGFSNTIVYATKIQKGKSNPFDDVLSIPMSPFTAMKGVDRAATSINRFTDTAARFSDIVEELPESVRWQLLTLLYDFEETDMTKSFLANMSQFSESSAQLAESTKNLPQEIRKEISMLVEDIDNKQANFQASLDKAQKTLIVAEQTLAQADTTIASFQAIVIDVNQAATAWEKAASSTQQALSEFSRLKPVRKEPLTEPSFKIKDVHDLSEAVNQTVGEMQNLTADIRDLVESEQLAGYASMPDRLVNLLVWRLGQLFTAVFVLALAYRIVIVRINYKKETRVGTKE